MYKYFTNTNVATLCLLMSFALFMTSCEDEKVGEYKLTGNIESLIPANSYNITRTITSGSNGTSYLVVVPELNDQFEYWGLYVKKIEYYIDNSLFKTVDTSPYDLICPVTEIGYGNHTVTAKITVSGEYCNDAVLEKSDNFFISSSGSVSSQTAQIYFDYNHICKGEMLHITPYVIEERSPKGSKITEAKYYWDDKLIATKTTSPFTWDYQVDADAGTSHSIRVSLRYSDDNNTNNSLSWSYSNYTVMNDDDCIYYWERKLADNENEYQNGETVESIAKVYKGKNNKNTYTFKLYFDGTVIAESTAFPYEVDYKLENLVAGSHIFKSEWTIKRSDDTSYKTSQNHTIIIVP